MFLPIWASFFSLANSLEIRNVTVIDVRTGNRQPNRSVFISGDKIEAVTPTKRTPSADVQVIDGKGKFLIPGLWDMHAHFFLPEPYWGLFTANGVTGVRIMFGAKPFFKLNDAFESGSKIGPRLYIGGPIMDGPKPIWPGSVRISSPEEGRAAVRAQWNEGYSFVKVYSALPRESYLAIADECKRVGLPFEGHLPMGVSLAEASNTGQKSVEHLLGTLLAFANDDGKLQREAVASGQGNDYEKMVKEVQPLNHEAISLFSPSAGQNLVRTLIRNRTYICPTLTVLRSTAHLDDPTLVNDPRSAYVPKFLTDAWNPAKDFRFKSRTKESWEWARKTYAEELQITRILAGAGVFILAGTDCMNPYCYPGFSLQEELQLLVKAGLTNLQALQAATSRAAEFMDRKDVGAIRRGCAADLVLLSADPLLDIANTQRIEVVFNHGRAFDRAALDRLLTTARTASGQGGSAPAGFMADD